jgi:hypothetical protein
MEKDEAWKNEMKDFSIGESGKRNIPAPEGYFDQFPDRLMERWQLEKNQADTQFIGLRRMITVAAVVIGIALGVTLLTKHPESNAAIPEISTVDAYQYILENINDFAPLMLEPGQQAEASPQETPEENNPAVLESHELEEYLLEEMENEDFETLF